MIHPCIDLAKGRVVQLRQGEDLALEFDSYAESLEQFSPFPLIHVIDLDAAKGEGSNEELVREIVNSRPCRVGGGIRSVENALRWSEAGAQQVIVGSALFQDDRINLDFVNALRARVGQERLIFALDLKGGEIATHGWRKSLTLPIEEAIAHLNHACAGFLVTTVDHEGLLEGTDVALFLELRRLVTGTLTAAGGISTIQEVQSLNNAGIAVALGMSVYTGNISIQDLVVQMNSESREPI